MLFRITVYTIDRRLYLARLACLLENVEYYHIGICHTFAKSKGKETFVFYCEQNIDFIVTEIK